MIPYGETKRTHKIHPHNECSVCSEKSFGKKTARQAGKKEIKKQFTDYANTECLGHEIQEYFDQKYIDEIEIELGL